MSDDRIKWNRTAAECYTIKSNCAECSVRALFQGECHMKEAVAKLIKMYGEPKVEGENNMDERKLIEINEFRKRVGTKYLDEARMINSIKTNKREVIHLTEGDRELIAHLPMCETIIANRFGIKQESLRVRLSNLYKKCGIPPKHSFNTKILLIVKLIKEGLVNINSFITEGDEFYED